MTYQYAFYMKDLLSSKELFYNGEIIVFKSHLEQYDLHWL